MSSLPPESVEVSCPRCKFRIAVSVTSAGTSRQCPGCRTDFLITGKMLGLPAEDIGSAEDYGLQDLPPPPTAAETDRWTTPSILESPTSVAPQEVQEELASEAEKLPTAWKPTRRPPWWLFTQGMTAFLGDPGTWTRGLTLGLWILISVGLINLGMTTAAAGTRMSVVASVLFEMMGIVLQAVVFMIVAAYGMAVLLDSADGLSVIVNWPRGFLVDWLPESFSILAALLWGILPGLLANCTPPTQDLPLPLLLAASEAVFFPIVLLAAIDANTPALPSSAAVWKSLFRCGFVWLWFFALSIPLLALIAWLYQSGFHNAGFLKILLASTGSAGWFLYFRLLGRLAWYCSGRCEQMEND